MNWATQTARSDAALTFCLALIGILCSDVSDRAIAGPVTSPALKTKLDKPLIVEAALRLLEEVGLDGLSTRALAAALGVKGPSLYWHFQNMGELRDMMADAILADALAAADEGPADWRAWLAEGARTIRGAARVSPCGWRDWSGRGSTPPTPAPPSSPSAATPWARPSPSRRPARRRTCSSSASKR
jgi:hypothetical protein